MTESELVKLVKRVINEQPKKTCQFTDLSQFINELKKVNHKQGRWFKYTYKPEIVGLTAAAHGLDFQEMENQFCNIQTNKLQLPQGKNEGRWSFDGTNVIFK